MEVVSALASTAVTKLTTWYQLLRDKFLALDRKHQHMVVGGVVAFLVVFIILIYALVCCKFDADFNDECVAVHNQYRAKHGADNLVVDEDLAELAYDHAKYLAKSGTLEHSDLPHGESLYWTSKPDEESCEVVVKEWYRESRNYFYSRGSAPSKITGHFTQIVWKATERIGCARYESSSGKMAGTYVVCEYDPPVSV